MTSQLLLAYPGCDHGEVFDHVRAIEENGLRIEGIDAETVRVRAATRVQQLKPDALILLTTKVPATVSALESITPLVRDDTTIVALQNGLDADEIARGLSPFNAEGAAKAAGRLMIERMRNLVRDGQSFAFETTCSGRA